MCKYMYIYIYNAVFVANLLHQRSWYSQCMEVSVCVYIIRANANEVSCQSGSAHL